MEIEAILSKIDVESVTSTKQIFGGADSLVWKVNTVKGNYAVRLLPRERHEQFLYEQKVINLAESQGIPVPSVYSVNQCGEWSVMLMEWAKGEPLLNHLTKHPEKANRLGNEFGRVHSAIHALDVPESFDIGTLSWLSPKNVNETKIMEKLSPAEKEVLLHLDYHPLNVLTDGNKITTVIDWANASVGDSRFDIARTGSILQIEGERVGIDSFSLKDFEEGWLEGYKQAAGPLDSLSLYYAWAGFRIKIDLAERLSESDMVRIDQWIEEYLRKSESDGRVNL